MSAIADTSTRRRSAKPWSSSRKTIPRRPLRSTRKRLLTDRHWSRLAPLVLEPDANGSRAAETTRRALEGVLWVLRNGASWSALPKGMAAATTCQRHWRLWMRDGRWLDLWRAYVATLDSQEWLSWSRELVRSGERISEPGSSRKDGSARYAWWLVSARVFLWEAPWLPARAPSA